MSPVTAIVLAAGHSARLPGDVPKPFLAVRGRPMLGYSLAAFAAAPSVSAIVVAVPEDRLVSVPATAPKVVAVVAGGPSRQESLACALAQVPEDATVIAVHDAARPLVSPEVIEAVLAAVGNGTDGAVTAVPLDDAIKAVDDARTVVGPRSRAGLWRAQTPQAFRRSCLEDALRRALADGVLCDDCSEMATRIGYAVRVVPGDPRNIKVTRPADLALCEALLTAQG
ncbi:MAG TPA: 2-C-methyl-D-erythritol 4-phosphate cytidylyltransferase [Actinomycetota bacterium]|nr:2-C-methyl-D-erythritol 4-phosphate cytidylyltransferase [Actinomycetota bacterium]